jgi:hypothetical protein
MSRPPQAGQLGRSHLVGLKIVSGFELDAYSIKCLSAQFE